MESNSKGGGVIALVVLVLGILLFTGVIGPTTGVIAKILHFIGVAMLVAGAIILLLLVAVIFAAIKSKDTDPDAGAKASINKSIADQRQQLAKLKSNASLLEMDIKKLRTKIKDIDVKISTCEDNARKYLLENNEPMAQSELVKKQELERAKKTMLENEAGYQKSLDDVNRMIYELEGGVEAMQMRRDNAVTKMNMAKASQNINRNKGIDSAGSDELDDFESKAMYEADYAAAMRELNGETMRQER